MQTIEETEQIIRKEISSIHQIMGDIVAHYDYGQINADSLLKGLSLCVTNLTAQIAFHKALKLIERTEGGEPNRLIRNESTPEARQIWDAVDKAAESCPEWIKQRMEDGE